MGVTTLRGGLSNFSGRLPSPQFPGEPTKASMNHVALLYTKISQEKEKRQFLLPFPYGVRFIMTFAVVMGVTTQRLGNFLPDCVLPSQTGFRFRCI